MRLSWFFPFQRWVNSRSARDVRENNPVDRAGQALGAADVHFSRRGWIDRTDLEVLNFGGAPQEVEFKKK
jgi:hypothetical protein